MDLVDLLPITRKEDAMISQGTAFPWMHQMASTSHKWTWQILQGQMTPVSTVHTEKGVSLSLLTQAANL